MVIRGCGFVFGDIQLPQVHTFCVDLLGQTYVSLFRGRVKFIHFTIFFLSKTQTAKTTEFLPKPPVADRTTGSVRHTVYLTETHMGPLRKLRIRNPTVAN